MATSLPKSSTPKSPTTKSSTTKSPTTKSSTTKSPTTTNSAFNTAAVPVGWNLAVVRGFVRRSPEFRVLPSGDELLSFDLTVRDGDLPAETVPVVWHNPSTSAAKITEGDDVVVVGRVRRRFFRVAGSTASRTEVHADTVLSSRSTTRIRTALLPRVEGLNL